MTTEFPKGFSLVIIDGERNLLEVRSADTFGDFLALDHTELPEGAHFTVVVLKDTQYDSGEIAEWTDGLVQHHDVHNLDTLVLTGNTYRSLLCSNDLCCPPEGKEFTPPSRLNRLEELSELESMLSLGSLPADYEAYVNKSLMARDLLLLAAAKTGQTAWTLLADTSPESANTWAVRAAAFIALGVNEAATECIKNALAIDPNHSLTMLLRRAVESDMTEVMVPSFLATEARL
jgi:tetratricopeptide (TPR) repeat protein